MSYSAQTVVAGAGVVGLAIARALASSGREVVILDAAEAIGTGVSSRNSEVIHAGIYYGAGSLKARFCVAGKKQLYDYCESRSIEHRRVGKLIVATEEAELPALSGIRERAERNGVFDLRHLDAHEAAALEPELRTAGALFSPSTGIVDSHALMLSLLGEAEAAGAVTAFASPIDGGEVSETGTTLEVGGETPTRLECREFVNSSGLGAQAVARSLSGFVHETVPPLHYAKGNYFVLAGASPFNHLIYPVPVPGGLGTHSTLDLGGQTKFGPDVEWVTAPDYTVDPARAASFAATIRRYWPGLDEDALEPGYVGVRPKLTGPDSPTHDGDFAIHGPETHGAPGLVNLYGIESPGLTSSLAIADYVVGLLDRG